MLILKEARQLKNNLPVMLLKRIVLLPNQDVRLDLNSEISSRVIDLSINKHGNEILIVCPVDPYEESPDVSDLPSVGVVGRIKSKMELPNDVYSGIYISKIISGSSAANAGVCAGDIITRVDDIEIIDNASLAMYLYTKNNGDTIKLYTYLNPQGYTINI